MFNVPEMYQDVFILHIRCDVKGKKVQSAVSQNTVCPLMYCSPGRYLIKPVQLGSFSSVHITLPYVLGEDRNWLLTTERADQTVNITINQE